MRQAAFGQSLLSGLVIALMAMVMDRITLGYAGEGAAFRPAWLTARRFWGTITILLAIGVLLHAGDFLLTLPFADQRGGLINAEAMNHWVLGLVAAYANPLETFKNDFLYFFILPLRIGMIRAVARSPGYHADADRHRGLCRIIAALPVSSRCGSVGGRLWR